MKRHSPPYARPRTPAERAILAPLLTPGSPEYGKVWVAYGPKVGTCGHRHLNADTARRCVNDARPSIGYFPPPVVGTPSTPPPPRRRGWLERLASWLLS